MKAHRIALLVAICSTLSLLPSCKKDEEGEPTEYPTIISSMCIGEWRSDSSFNISNSQYHDHPTGTFRFTNDGRLHIGWPDGSTDDLRFYVGEEATNTGPGELGRSLLWIQELDGTAEYWGGILMIYQTPAECNLLFSDDIAPTAAEYTLANVNEFLWVDNDPVFDYWSKCHRQ